MSWIRTQVKVVGCKWIISFHPSLFPSLCSTSLANFSAESSSAKSHSPDLSDIFRTGLSHVTRHVCQLRLLRQATPLSLTHTGLHNSWSPVLQAPWDNPSATMAIQCPWIGLFSCRGRWMSFICKCLPSLHTVPHPKARSRQSDLSLTRAVQPDGHWATAMSWSEGRVTRGAELCLLGTILSRHLQMLTWVSPGPSCATSDRVMGTFYRCMIDKIQDTLVYYWSGC